MKAIRIGICLLVAFAVLAHGAVEGWSEAILEIGAAALLVWWGLLVFTGRESEVCWNALYWPLAGFAGVALLQILARRTVYPYLTRIELLKLGACLLLFFLAVQAFRTLEQWQGLVWFLLAVGFVVSVFGILQHFTFNGKLYWVRELRYGGVPFGPYVNRNHFAGLIELLVPPGLAILVLRAVRRDQLPLVALFTLLPIGALFLAASRGGIASFLLQLGLLAILIWSSRRERKSLAAAALVLLLAVGLIAWLGVGRALDRFAKFQSLEVTEARRLVMIRDSWRIFLDHRWIGTGLGTLSVVYPRYESFYDGKIVNHAHNDYVEVLAEAGVVGGVCSLAFIVLLFRSGLARLSASRISVELAIRTGALVACTGLLAHSLVDFNLHIPSNALLFLLQAALATSAVRPTLER
ncbi:MAG: O-antigen ligase family protein [Acidobacteria bacterium]|nr:O-antigen ligase family protein [Acidobacteriota bacterium]